MQTSVVCVRRSVVYIKLDVGCILYTLHLIWFVPPLRTPLHLLPHLLSTFSAFQWCSQNALLHSRTLCMNVEYDLPINQLFTQICPTLDSEKEKNPRPAAHCWLIQAIHTSITLRFVSLTSLIFCLSDFMTLLQPTEICIPEEQACNPRFIEVASDIKYQVPIPLERTTHEGFGGHTAHPRA